MNFRPRRRATPELNLIPMIDVMIVLLIFLVLTTTFSREAQMKINLPEASSGVVSEERGINIVVDEKGIYTINDKQLPDGNPETLSKELEAAVGDEKDPLIIIEADKLASHQSVMKVLDAAGQAGYRNITFATAAEETRDLP